MYDARSTELANDPGGLASARKPGGGRDWSLFEVHSQSIVDDVLGQHHNDSIHASASGIA